MRKLNWIVLSLLLAVSAGCASGSGVRPQKPELPEPPKEVMAPRKADFLTRMQNFLFDSPPKPTESSDN